jgi:hypothetical protein
LNSDSLFHWAQFSADLITVVSIIVVIIQLRAANIDRKVEAASVSIESYTEVLSSLAENEDLASIYHRGLKDPKELNDIEEIRFSCFIGQLFWSWEMIYNQSKRGRTLSENWQDHLSIVDDLLTNPGAQSWWQARKHWYSPEFRDLIESRISGNSGRSIHGWRKPAEAAA